MSPFKIILADDHKILREGLKNLIEQDKKFKVVGQVKDGQELLDLALKVKADLIVLDLCMPNMGGIESLKLIKAKLPKVKVLVLTMQKDPEHFRHAIKNGADGYILKEDAYEQLMMAIKIILQNKKFISPTIKDFVADQYVRSLDEAESSSLEILTKREQQILRLIAEGLANKNVAAKLKLSIRTVEAHRANLTKKLGVKNTPQLIKYALSKGLA